MAAIPVTFQGILFFSDVGAGGGPMPGGPRPPYVDIGFPMPQPPAGAHPEHPIYYPPYPSHPIYNPGGPPGSSPPGYWGGGMGPGVKPQPHPEHPIVLPPVTPGGPPVQIWPNPPEGQAPIPSHPIVLPPPPTEGTTPDGGKPPPPDGGWGYHPAYGWGYFPAGGKPLPGAPGTTPPAT
jgi:hypothetical protein